MPLQEMVHKVKHAENSDDRIQYTQVRTDATTITMDREKIKCFTQLEVNSAAESVQREDIRGQAEGTVGDIFITGY